jgi:hypothetical protein
MKNKQSNRHEYTMYRPKVPTGWDILEQLDNTKNSYIAFYRWAKTHHAGEPERVFAIFCEFNPHSDTSPNFRYSVRGGRKAKPDENLKTFNDIKDATAYLLYIMESTDRWIDEINSPDYIKAYDDRIAKLVADEEKRKENLKRY